MEDEVTRFSDRLNEARGAESIRSAAARAATVGHVGESTIASYFRDGHRRPSMRVLVGLASALGIPVDELRELASPNDGRGRSMGGGDAPMAALIDSASVLHGGASHQVLARIARQGGHEISSATLLLLRSRPVRPRVGRIGGIKQGTIRAVAFLAQVPESVVREAAGVCDPEVTKQAAAARNRSMQSAFHAAGQAITLPAAFNQRGRWTRAEDERILAFMQAPNARINDLAKELGRSRAGITNRLQKLRRWRRESATASVDCSAIQTSSYEIAAEPGPTHCVGCGDELTDANAYSAGAHSDRWKRRCRPCTRAAARARYQSDPAVREKKRSSVRERYRSDPELREKQKARIQEWRLSPEGRVRRAETRRMHRSRETEQERERYQANREAINARRRKDEVTCEVCGGVFRGTRGLSAHKNNGGPDSLCKTSSPA
ncbi:helix-turn-helix domain-containing protein [Mycobacteroides abscessus]|uniref:helix-turn-helix domain-containing protein n=1 Tax=Mycobacteroides abscessus TaxID=36809 RepID=UPI0009413E6F